MRVRGERILRRRAPVGRAVGAAEIALGLVDRERDAKPPRRGQLELCRESPVVATGEVLPASGPDADAHGVLAFSVNTCSDETE
jgi:hypothetical protein